MGVYPKMDGFYHGKSENQLDENWGYPYMTKQKPPYNYIYMEFPALSDTRIAQRTENLFEAFDLSCASISLSLSVLILHIQVVQTYDNSPNPVVWRHIPQLSFEPYSGRTHVSSLRHDHEHQAQSPWFHVCLWRQQRGTTTCLRQAGNLQIMVFGHQFFYRILGQICPCEMLKWKEIQGFK